VSFKSMMEGG